MKKFSEFSHELNGLDGEKMRIADVLGVQIILTAYRIIESKIPGKQALHIQFTLPDGTVRTAFTNSQVLMRQCREYESEMPFVTTIIKHGKYYTLS